MRSDEPLYKRDPDAWRAHLAEGNATQPRKRVSVGLLMRDEGGWSTRSASRTGTFPVA
nr:hypothetical protein GCM10010200_100740 [Actinomadura rugatobispora]